MHPAGAFPIDSRQDGDAVVLSANIPPGVSAAIAEPGGQIVHAIERSPTTVRLTRPRAASLAMG